MKILIVSDTHRRDGNLREVIDRMWPFDMLIHLGDTEGSERFFADWLPGPCQIHVVQGNNDFFSGTDREKEIRIGNYRALLTHGHLYGVSLGVEALKDEAVDRNLDLAMYGHTHKPYLEYWKDKVILNPGSLSFPRQEGRKASFAVMELDRFGKAHFRINYIDTDGTIT